jgi:Protein of unknown function (DUF1572)
MDNYLAELYERDLFKLRDEIKNFKDEDNLWEKSDGISNSAGTLVLHLLGNLNFCIGTQLGNTGYVRNREQEFSMRDVPREKLIADIEKLVPIVKSALENISQQKLEEIYPLEMFGQKSTSFYLMHFYGHLNYHLGQINYLRRILEG